MSKDRNTIVVKSSSNMSLTAAAAAISAVTNSLTNTTTGLGATSEQENDYGFQFRKALIELNRVNELKGILLLF